jgi:predicted flap endonuclease-1-like 5' DNA nuclease
LNITRSDSGAAIWGLRPTHSPIPPLHVVIQPARSPAMGLPLAKLRQVPPLLRAALKVRHITTSDQLLAAAGRFEDRAALAHAARIDPDQLTDLVRQADLARVKGIGWGFGLMLEALGVGDVATLAQQQSVQLHERLRRYNQTHRLARRAPTADEVTGWISQARQLPLLITYPPRIREAGQQP